MEDPSSIFKEHEVVYKGVRHPRLAQGDRCMVRVEEHVKKRAEIIAVRMYRNHNVFEFLVHFDHLPDRRYDSWVTEALISDVEKANEDEAELSSSSTASPAASKRDVLRRIRRKPLPPDQQPKLSKAEKEDEAKQYDEYTKVKYVSEVHVGSYLISTWYFSPFAREMLRYKRLHICPTCLLQFALEDTYGYHYGICAKRSPPGHLLYQASQYAIYEVDGVEDRLFCQLLSLLGKCFIKEKTLVHYVDDFKFYVLCELRRVDDKERHEIVGYFSKEKQSEEGYNLACLVVLPPFMGKGYGSLLIDLSYILTRREKKVGSPEKPLSAMGKRAYLNYWTFMVVKSLLGNMERFHAQYSRQQGKKTYKTFIRPIDAVARETGIHPDDVRAALRNLKFPADLFVDKNMIVTPAMLRAVYDGLRAKYARNGAEGPMLINPDLIVWPSKSSSSYSSKISLKA